MRHMSNDNKKRICFVATYTYALFHHDDSGLPVTGLDVQLYNWATAFARDGEYEVHFVVGDFGQEEKEIIDGVTLWKFSRPGRKGIPDGLLSFSALYNLFKKIDADVYIDRGASGPISFEVGILSKILKTKFIHMIASDSDVSGEYQKKSRLLESVTHTLALRLADGVTFQNSFQGDILEKSGIKSWKIQNSFPVKEVTSSGQNSILWVGSSYSLKQPEIFLDLARNFPRESFVIVMQRHDKEIFLNIEQEARSIDNVRFIPGVPFHKVDEIFCRAKLLINTSTYEGFPNTFVQSAIFSIPIISLNVNPDNILTEYDFGIFCNNDKTVLADSLTCLLENDEQRRRMSANARYFAQHRFDISKNIVDFKRIFSEALCL